MIDKKGKDVGLVVTHYDNFWKIHIFSEINVNEKVLFVSKDEVFQVLTAQKVLADTFLQSAKFGLKYILTLHNLEGLSKEALASLKRANTSYTLDKEDFESLEKEFDIHGYCVYDLLNLKRFTAIHLLKCKDGYKELITKLPPELKIHINIEQIAA